jgi:hypothetical protein
VRIKEMGLPAEHPLKEGELISLENLEDEVQQRLALKKQLDSIVREAAGLRVVHGIKSEDVQVSSTDSPTPLATEQPTPAISDVQAAERPAEAEAKATGGSNP